LSSYKKWEYDVTGPYKNFGYGFISGKACPKGMQPSRNVDKNYTSE
jgi:hypothetical protein